MYDMVAETFGTAAAPLAVAQGRCGVAHSSGQGPHGGGPNVLAPLVVVPFIFYPRP